MSAVEIRNITKRFGTRTILKDVSFSVEDGELVALSGPSGCGKSTLLNMIGTLEAVDKGDIRLYGRKLPGINSRKATMLRRNTINYLFQSFALISDMTVFQNLLLSMRFLHLRQREKEKRIHQILQTVGLSHLEYAVVNTLSGGEQQRVALARTILKPGKLILADEPTGALDGRSAELSFSLIRNLCQKYHKTVIMVTHSLDLAQRADRVIDLASYQTQNAGSSAAAQCQTQEEYIRAMDSLRFSPRQKAAIAKRTAEGINQVDPF